MWWFEKRGKCIQCMVRTKAREVHIFQPTNQSIAHACGQGAPHHTHPLPLLNPKKKNLCSILSSSLKGLFLYFFPFLLQRMRLGPYPSIKTPFFFHFWPPKRLLDSSFSPFFKCARISFSLLLGEGSTNQPPLSLRWLCHITKTFGQEWPPPKHAWLGLWPPPHVLKYDSFFIFLRYIFSPHNTLTHTHTITITYNMPTLSTIVPS